MAERNGPMDGKRFKRVTPSGNHKGKTKPTSKHSPRAAERGVNTRAGETLCTPEMVDKITKLIRAGNYAHIAASCCGISTSTFHNWLLRGGRGELPYRLLVEAVEKAKAEDEAGTTAQIRQHGSTHWQALAWMLERKYNKRWGRRDALEITGDEDKPLQVKQQIDLKRLSTEELRTLKKLRAKARVDDDAITSPDPEPDEPADP